ncbi:TetR/AcrR family transcriptional regulator C-terminal domain-containing protein [Paenibacillus puldeungensis]|uniref:TetR/AcrR family transcriptional regulator C-terminal domain-containing protein n=1 Tax=Paenibacillus puldeungensis TaxID=696536 RepID=A0ABW3RSG6_9BACL
MENNLDTKSDRRIRKTKKALKEGLTSLMSEKSIKNISVKELTEKVDINRGTFYLHYKDVFDMVEQLEAEMLKDFTKVMESHTASKLNEQPLPLLTDIFLFLKENAPMCAALLSSNGDIAFANHLKEIVREKCLKDWRELFHNGKVNNFEYFYSFILSGCIGLFETWLKNGLVETPEQMAKLAEEMITYGIKVLK